MDKLYIKSIIQNVLNIEFKNSDKRKINEYSDRFNFACSYCQDSLKNNHMKRGNLYTNKLFFICFNCGKKTSFNQFCKDFNQQIDPDKKLEMIEYLSNNTTYKDYEDTLYDTKFDKLLDMVDIERIFSDGSYGITDFKPIEPQSITLKYLLDRGIPFDKHKNIYQAKSWYNEDRYENVICLLNRNENKVLGIQIRNLKEGKRRSFKIFNFETLYKWIYNKDEVDDIDINQLVIYNKLSSYFNILNIDFTSTVTIFEGYLDSLFYPNSIGVVGTNTNVDFLELSDINIQYMYDNDMAGFKKSDEKIKKGYPVFLWKKLFENIVEKKQSEDPYKLLHRISKVKDLNKLAELIPLPYSKLKLYEFFSKDIMDIKYIPKYKREYKKYSN